LVDNASKYSPAGGRITLRWWVDGDGGHFSVADTGPGIPPEHLPRLTERFYRVDPGRARDAGGSGLGLAIVRHVLQRHGGELAIRSEEGQGSTFTCHLPPSRIVRQAVALPGESGYAPADRA
jgi:two-component system phosphate regulon sensor histidine kinase PhoR